MRLLISSFAFLVLANAAEMLGAAQASSWEGLTVFPRESHTSLKHGDKIVSCMHGKGEVFEERGDWVRVRHESYSPDFPNRTEGFVKKQDLVRSEDALAYYTSRMEANPSDVTWRHLRSLVWSSQGNTERAIQDLDVAIRMTPEAWLFINRGLRFMDGEDYERAIEDFDEALRREPTHIYAYYNRGRTRFLMGQFSRAVEDLQRAIDLDPEYGYLWLELGRARMELREYEQAIRDLSQAIRRLDNNGFAYILRGRSRFYRGSQSRALEDFDEAVRKLPKWGVAYYDRAVTRAHLKNFEGAIADLEKAVEVEPEMTRAYTEAGRLWYERMRFDRAYSRFERAIESNSDDAFALNGMAWFLATCPDEKYRDGNRAVKLAYKACELSEWQNDDLVGTLSAAYAAAGCFEDARYFLDQAVELNSDTHEGMIEDMRASYAKRKRFVKTSFTYSR